jgi:SAM-dependent methyltransferase
MDIKTLFEIGMDRELGECNDAPGGTIINVGAGNKDIKNAIPFDYPEWDADREPLPLPDDSVACIHAYHFLEHVQNPAAILQEFQRVLHVGGVVNIVVPYYTSQMAAHDLDHKHVFCEETWRVLFGNPYYDKNRVEWRFKIGVNVIMGIVERNLALITQLVRVP